MRIQAVYKYYWPDTTPYARILKDILERWAAVGHDVEVLTAQPGYNDIPHPPQPRREQLGGVTVWRDPIVREIKSSRARRLASFLIFLGRAVWRACTGPRADVILVNLHPPILMGLAVRLIKRLRGVPYIYHCVDIHPESALSIGSLKPGLLYRWLRRLDTANCRAAAVVVTLSEDMVNTLVARGVPRECIAVINNFILAGNEPCPIDGPVLPSLMDLRDEDFVIVFGGNLGRFQGLDHVIRAARSLADRPDLKFLFLGEGSAKAGLIAQAGDLSERTIFFRPHQPMPVAKQILAESDLALVPLGPDVYKVAYPSKTMNCLAAGCPVLAVVEAESTLSRDIAENGLGYSCAQGDPEETACLVRDAADRRAHWRARRPEIARWAEARFGRDRILELWRDVLASLEAREGRETP